MNPLLFLSRLCGQVPFSPLQNCSLCKALASSSSFTKDNEQTNSQWAFDTIKSRTENMALYLYGKSSWLLLPVIARIQETMMLNARPMNIKASSMNIKAPTLGIGNNSAKCDAMERRKTREMSEYHMNRQIVSSSPATPETYVGNCSSPQPHLVEEPIHPSVPSAFPRLYGKNSPCANQVPSSDIIAPIQEAPTLRRVDSKEWIKDFKNKKERIDKINFHNIFGGIGDAHNNEIPSLPPLNTDIASPRYSPLNVPSSPSSTSSHSTLCATDLTPNDVICGRGGKANSHPGNISFRSEALKLRSWYESSSKSEKYTISNMLVDFVKERGGRFLKRDGENPGRWLECDGNDVRKKASQALREGKFKDSRDGG
jgi:hypothetical protein